jgi:hypothetical protein
MKILNFFISKKLAKFEKISKSLIISQIKDNIKMNENFKLTKTSSIYDSLFENILIKIINERCEKLSTTSSFIKDQYSLDVKLFGENNYILNNSKWIKLNENGSLNSSLTLQNIDFSESHIYFVVNEHLKFYELENKTINSLILPLIKKSKIDTIGDLRKLVDEILYNNQEENKNRL